MEFLVEFILTVLFEGSAEAAKNKKLPKFLRILAGSFIGLATIAMLAFILWGAALGLLSGIATKSVLQIAGGLFLLGVVISALVYFIKRLAKELKKRGKVKDRKK